MKIVAELGINTNGSLDTALRMVEAAAEAGADGIKVQAYRTADFLPPGHPDWDLFEDNRLAWSEIERVQDETLALGMEFGATPTSVDGVGMLQSLKVDWLKNGSDFLLRTDLIDAMLATGIETWVSTGMATENEIAPLPAGLNFMACTSLYPTPQNLAHLARLTDGWHTGYSDHTRCTLTAPLCAALGAQMYETHFTLDSTMEGPDHTFSRTPEDLSLLVSAVRTAESLMGDMYPKLSAQDLVNRDKWRVTEGKLRS